jgi:CRISPR system Cascade subunit CasE
MYLSNLILNPRSRQANIDKGNPYELHRSLMLAFPAFDHEQERVLFRLEMRPDNQVLVQSTLIPDWSRLAENYLVSPPVIKPLELSLTPGQLLRFRLRANPSKRDPQTHKRVGLYSDAERLDWLRRKGEQNGYSFEPENVTLTSAPWQHLSIPSNLGGKRQQAKFNFVDFNGVLRVIDPDQLVESIRQGVGPAKGFGCGLLSLARV